MKNLSNLLKKIDKIWPFGLFILLGLISLAWFGGKDFLFGDDTLIPVKPGFVDEYFGIWSQKQTFGGTDVIKLAELFPFMYILKLWFIFQLPYSALIFERILVFLLFTFCGISAYILSSVSFPKNSRSSHTVAGVFYMLSFYTMFIFNALPFFLLFSYVFFPLVLAFYIRLLSKGGISYAIGGGVISFFLMISSYSAPPYIVIHFFILFLYFLTFVFRNKKELKRAAMLSAVFFVSFVLVGLWWLYPLLTVKLPSFQSFRFTDWSSVKTFDLNNSPLIDTVRMSGYFGFKSGYKGYSFYPWYKSYTRPVLTVMGFAILGLTFLGMICARKNRNYLFYVVLSLVFIYFVSSGYLPLTNVRNFLGGKIWFFDLFRTSYQRFSGFISMCFAVMVGFGFEQILERVKDKFSKIYIFILTTVFLVGYVSPVISGEMFNQNGILVSKKVVIPKSYFEVDKKLQESNVSDFNVLVFPYSKLGTMPLWWNNGTEGYNGIYPFVHFSKLRIISNDGQLNILDSVREYLRNENFKFSIFSKALNVGYVFFHKDVNWRFLQGNGWLVGENPFGIGSKLGSDECLEKPESLGEIILYKVKAECVGRKIYTFSANDALYYNGDFLNYGKMVSTDANLLDRNMITDSPREGFDFAISAEMKNDIVEDDSFVQSSVSGPVQKKLCSGYCLNLEVPFDGRYVITVNGGFDSNLLIDGNITNGSDVFFQKGMHEFRLNNIFPQAVKLDTVLQDSSGNTPVVKSTLYELVEKQMGKRPYSLFAGPIAWDPNSDYFISFDYSLSDGFMSVMVVEELTDFMAYKSNEEIFSSGLLPNKTGLRKVYESEYAPAVGKWENVSFDVSSSEFPDSKFYLEFDFAGNKYGVENVSVEKKDNPYLVIKSVKEKPKVSDKVNSWEKISRGLYRGSLSEVGKEPFVLVLSEKFDDGWGVYAYSNRGRSLGDVLKNFGSKLLFQNNIKEKIDKIPSEHVKVNNFLNGWVIDPKVLGSSTIIIKYAPEDNLDLGFAVSTLSLIVLTNVSVGLFVKRKIKND